MKQRELKILEKGAGMAIAATLGCTPQTVTNALKGRRYSVLISKIRKYAIMNYTCVYYAGSGLQKRRYEVVRLCQECRHHIETQEGDWCPVQETYIRTQKTRCKYRTSRSTQIGEEAKR